MLRFFRSIRRGLIKEGKTSKYFKYAIGEFVLEVLGILTALQINNWSERRKDLGLWRWYVDGVISGIMLDVLY